MTVFITVVHILTCLSLVAIVLLQHGRGADIGVSFGGGASNTVFGARGSGNFLTKLTTGAAVVFMLTSLVLSYFSNLSEVGDILTEEVPPEVLLESEEAAPESQFPEAQPLEAEEAAGDEITGLEETSAPAAESGEPPQDATEDDR